MEVNGGLTEELYNHGMSLNPRNDRVQCNYCGLVVAGFDYLRNHLSGSSGKGSMCHNVPCTVKDQFKSGLNIVEEKDFIQKAENQCKADFAAGSTPNSKGDSRKRGKTESPRSGGPKTEIPRSDGPKDSKRVHRTASVSSALRSHDESAEKKKLLNGEGHQSVMIKRWICRFLIENAIDFDAAKSYSYRKMMEVVSHTNTCHVPSIQELKGSIFSDEMEETRICVDAIRESWSKTGCSIVLDGWIDGRDRSLMIVVVDCPLGAVYIDTFDISTLVEDIEGFLLLIEGILEEVGIQNVIQIISHASSDFMNAVGERLTEKHRSLFWSVSASHCVALMLDKIGMVKTVKLVLDSAKMITRFIYSQPDALKLMRSHSHSFDLIKSSKIKAAMPFFTLEKILIEKTNLEKLVSSPEWTSSSWASNAKGKRVANLINDKSFWDRITVVVRATFPLAKVLSLINGDGDPGVGFIYETLDQVKETVKEQVKLEKIYKPYWNIIDDIWNKILHIPLHAAGYVLNPRFKYTEDFYSDDEVRGGLLITIVRMVEDLRTQDLVLNQLNKVYYGCQGAFEKGTENEKHIKIPPALWWTTYGSHCPDLQKVAVRILSQSCNGAESYDLKKDVAEKLVFNGDRNDARNKQLRNLAYVHYNMTLKHRKLDPKWDAGEIDLDCDWIVEEEDL